MWNEAIWFNDTCSNMEDREGRGRRERAKRERCKEVPRGSISPASEHINRSQPYYSQSKADENRKKRIHWRKGGKRSEVEARKSPEWGRDAWIWHVTKNIEPLSQTCGLECHVQWSQSVNTAAPNLAVLFCFGGRWREVTQEQLSPNVQILNDKVCDTICNT